MCMGGRGRRCATALSHPDPIVLEELDRPDISRRCRRVSAERARRPELPAHPRPSRRRRGRRAGRRLHRPWHRRRLHGRARAGASWQIRRGGVRGKAREAGSGRARHHWLRPCRQCCPPSVSSGISGPSHAAPTVRTLATEFGIPGYNNNPWHHAWHAGRAVRACLQLYRSTLVYSTISIAPYTRVQTQKVN